jgi:hypothetical protein
VKAPKSGLITKQVGEDLPRDFVTWHNVEPYRIWVHSRLYKGEYKTTSVEIQWIGDSPTPISEEEKSLRINLAAERKSEAFEAKLNSSTFRSVPFGEILDIHSSLVTNQRVSNLPVDNGKGLTVIKDIDQDTLEAFLKITKTDISIKELIYVNSELRATKTDSLIVAFTYSQQCENGSKKPAQMTAKILGIDVSLVYAAVKIARKNDWLTSKGGGQAGGVLTEKGRIDFYKSDASSRYFAYMKTFLIAVMQEKAKGEKR